MLDSIIKFFGDFADYLFLLVAITALYASFITRKYSEILSLEKEIRDHVNELTREHAALATLASGVQERSDVAQREEIKKAIAQLNQVKHASLIARLSEYLTNVTPSEEYQGGRK